MPAHYGSFERFVARLLAATPFIKRLVKALYARLVYLSKKKSHAFVAQNKISVVGGRESFFGYYDKSPDSGDGYLLAHLASGSTTGKPSASVPISLAVFPPGEMSRPIMEVPVRAYNWQQGTRAHWLTDDLFICNDFDDASRSYIARIFSKSGLREVQRLRHPVQDSRGDNFLLSINYRRLAALRPDYGYRNLPPLSPVELADLSNDGIWQVDSGTGDCRLICSLEQVARLEAEAIPQGALHKINHVMISPAGGFFIFLHRYYVSGRRYDRLVLADSAGRSLKLLADYAMVSHCFWINETTVFGYLRGPDGVDGYHFIDAVSGRFSRISNQALEGYGDGHPHVRGDWFVTDTYPDKARMQHLLLGNWKTGELRELGEFFHGFAYGGEARCDLHPRFSARGDRVFFDSVFGGKRKLCAMEVKT
jgi:hypothetical protein